MIRVLVVSNSTVVRAGLEALIRDSPTLALAGSLSGLVREISKPDWHEQAESLEADVILAELEIDDDDPLRDLAAIEGRGYDHGSPGFPPLPAIVILADNPPLNWTAEALRAGIRAVLPRDATTAEIVAAVHAAAAGLVVLRPDSVAAWVAGQQGVSRAGNLLARSSARTGDAEAEVLTPREVQILGMLAEGLGNKEIAWQLKISEHTVKFHLSSIFGKLGASTRTEAVTQGLRRGMIML